MGEKKKIYVQLEWEKKMTLTEVVCIEVPAEVEGTSEEIWREYRDDVLCDDSFEAPDDYAGWKCVTWDGEPELDDDEIVEAPARVDRTIKADWVDWEIPEGVEVDQFDPVLAGQKSIFELMGES